MAWVAYKYVKVYKVVKREEEEAMEDENDEPEIVSDEEAMVKAEDFGPDGLNMTNENLVEGK